MATPYKINIPLYEGPLDLLLDLIKKQEMNIHDIQIAKITSQYLDYLHKLEELNVDVSADFIYMAATLIYIKSKMLLPPDPLASPEEQSTDPRADLVQRLVEHEKFKNAAQLLYQKQQIDEPRRRHRGRASRLHGRPRPRLPTSPRAPQRSLSHRVAARAVHRGPDDGPAPRANPGQRRQHRQPHSLLRGLSVASRHDRRFPRRPRNGQDASHRHGPGKTVRRNRPPQA